MCRPDSGAWCNHYKFAAMKNILIVLTAILVSSCETTAPLTQNTLIPAEYKIRDSTQTFVIIDAADIMTTGIAIVKRREAVMQNVKSEYLSVVPDLVTTQLSMPVVMDTSLTLDQKSRVLQGDRNILDSLRNRHNAGVIGVLLNCYGGFEKDEVVTEKNQDGSKSKTAYYSVFFESTWQVIVDNINQQKIIMARRPHSSRPIISGLLARGPGFKANRKDLLEISRENAYEFTGLFQDRYINLPVRIK